MDTQEYIDAIGIPDTACREILRHLVAAVDEGDSPDSVLGDAIYSVRDLLSSGLGSNPLIGYLRLRGWVVVDMEATRDLSGNRYVSPSIRSVTAEGRKFCLSD